MGPSRLDLRGSLEGSLFCCHHVLSRGSPPSGMTPIQSTSNKKTIPSSGVSGPHLPPPSWGASSSEPATPPCKVQSPGTAPGGWRAEPGCRSLQCRVWAWERDQKKRTGATNTIHPRDCRRLTDTERERRLGEEGGAGDEEGEERGERSA